MILEGEETTECGPLPPSASMSDSTVRISAAQVTRILQRAAELDARSDTLSLGELRHIAAEAGIAPAATDAAIRELMNKPESASDALPTPAADAAPSVAGVARPSPSPLRVVAGGAVGMAMGFFTALPAVVGLTAFGVGILYLVTRAIQSMKRGAVLDFQLQNFALWFGILFGDHCNQVETGRRRSRFRRGVVDGQRGGRRATGAFRPPRGDPRRRRSEKMKAGRESAVGGGQPRQHPRTAHGNG